MSVLLSAIGGVGMWSVVVVLPAVQAECRAERGAASYAIIMRECFPAKEPRARVGIILMMTLLGMALGGWMSGMIFDLTGSYRAVFANGVIWNAISLLIALFLLFRSGSIARHLATAPPAGSAAG